MSNNITQGLKLFIKDYLEMDISGINIHCPYWMNKMDSGKIIMRGFANGKGNKESIRGEILKRLNTLSLLDIFPLNAISIQKFAKRNRIGIDCSGLAYRILEELILLGYANKIINNLNEFYLLGINKTNADIMTSNTYCKPISDICDSKLGDLIRINDGKHVAVIIGRSNGQIEYIHSHDKTEEQGVHKGIIKILYPNHTLENQMWIEKLRNGDNFGRIKFHAAKGDGIYRLKIFG